MDGHSTGSFDSCCSSGSNVHGFGDGYILTMDRSGFGQRFREGGHGCAMINVQSEQKDLFGDVRNPLRRRVQESV